VNNFLLWIAGLFALCLAALFAAPHFIDWNGYRGVFEKEASRVLGRRVRVGGEVNLRVLPIPYVSFDKLSIADVDSASGAPFIRADNFKMWLAVPPMLQGVLEAYRIELHRPVVELVGNAQGGGNWQSFEIRPGALPFVPGDVTLGEMDLVDGQIVYRNKDGDELTRVEAINGELSAAAISGPYKFAGNFTWLGSHNDLRFSTARQSGQGGPIRFKASIKSPKNGSSYVVDGAIDGGSGKTTLNGELTARLNGLMASASGAEGSAETAPSVAKDKLLDLRAKIDGDVQSVSLKDISLALQSEGPPQLMHGTASMSWHQETTLSVNLDSRWIDFDRFVPAAKTADKLAPFDHARRMLIALGRGLPEDTFTNLSISLDQATLGGEALGSIQLVAERRDGPLKLREFEARVPGGGKVAVSGSLAVSKSDPAFNGQIAAEGRSLLRFLRWGLEDPSLAEGLSDGPFDLQSDLKLDSDTVRLSRATIDFGATPLTGALNLDLGDKRRVALQLEGHTIDWSRLWPGAFNVSVAKALTQGAADQGQVNDNNDAESAAVPGPPSASRPSWLAGTAPTDVQVSLKATKLVDGDRTFRDFEGRVRSTASRLSVPVLKFAMDSGLAVDLKAEGASAVETSSGGSIKGLIEANSRLAVIDLLHFLDASEFDPYLRPRLTALAPLRIATTVNLAGASSKKTDMTFDGLSRGGRFVARLSLEDGLSNWRQAPADFSAMIENDQDHRLFSLLSSSRQFATGSSQSSKPGRIVIKAAGRPQKGMLTRAAVERDGLNMQYYGTVALPDGESVALDGRVECEADNLRQTFALLGLDVGGGVSNSSLSGEMALVRTDKTLRLEADGLKISGSTVSGLITLTQQTNAPSKLVVNLNSSSATLPGLLSVLLAKDRKTTAVSAALSEAERGLQDVAEDVKDVASIDESPVWPGDPFDLSPLLNVEGYITAHFDDFAFEPGLSMGKTRLEATVSPGKLSVTSLTGHALGGKANAKFELAKAAAGVTLKGDVGIAIGLAPSKPAPDNADKNAETDDAPGADPTASKAEPSKPTPAIAFDLNYAGRALSPQALVSDLDGDGKIVLADASLTGLTAKEVRTVAGEILNQQGIIETKVLVKALQDKIKQGQIKLGAITVPVNLQDGTLKVAPVEIESVDGKTRFKAELTLASMKFNSEWKITAANPGASEASENTDGKSKVLPPVSVLYFGQLNKLGELTPRIGTGALERELAVRKMERDVAELERLRKLDEARAKEEEDRRRELERSLREQREKAAERERLLKLQQEQGLIGPDGEPLIPPTVDELPDPDAESAIKSPPRRVRPKRRPKPPQNVWKPFQITPY
jgi:AsmA family